MILQKTDVILLVSDVVPLAAAGSIPTANDSRLGSPTMNSENPSVLSSEVREYWETWLIWDNRVRQIAESLRNLPQRDRGSLCSRTGAGTKIHVCNQYTAFVCLHEVIVAWTLVSRSLGVFCGAK